MHTHKGVGALFMDSPFLEIGTRVFETKFFAKSDKNLQSVLKKLNKKPNPIHFQETCFYQTEILKKNITSKKIEIQTSN